MVASLDEIFEGTRKHGRGCAVCGAESEALLQVRLQRFADAGRKRAGGPVRTKSRVFCAVHAVETFLRFTEDM